MNRLPLAALAASLLAGCASTPQLQSAPATTPTRIDGSDTDWQTDLQPVEGQTGLSLGVRNDGAALYAVAVVRGEQQVRQALAGGLTLWLDPDGGKAQAYGVRFPVVQRERGARPDPSASSADRLAASTRDLELLRDGEATGALLPASSASGPQAAASVQSGVLVVEYRIPLGDGATALDAAGAEAIGLGLTTPERERPEGAARGGRGGRGGGGMRGGGGRGGRGGGRPGGDRAERPQPLDVWVRVALAD
ncbi:MAG TPA: hypothetical protein EYQ24_15410 [Bacteroidetes bacterium]|nr:hypothetical protein [Bacteroidota bacterium]HIL57937.1 hypothetical protein [Rhodothermales bacterium]